MIAAGGNEASAAKAAPLAAPTASNEGLEHAASARPAGVVTDANLSKRWLKAEREPNKPLLVIGRDDANAFLAGYQARSGKRLLFRSAYLPNTNSEVLAEVLHLNPDTRRIERLIDRSNDIDPATGKRARDFKVNGTNLLGHLKAKRDKREGLEGARQKVAAFLDKEDGEAFLAAVPALYGAIEDDEISDRQANLKKPFGVLAMMLQMSGERYKGFADAEHFASGEKRKRMADSCASGECQMRGKGFVIHRSGFFDVISKPTAVRATPKAESLLGILTRQSSAPTSGSALASNGTSPLPSTRMDSLQNCADQKRDNPCFGKCGTGCGVIEPTLPECMAHDWCTCRFGDAACSASVPTECETEPETCGSLLAAVIAVGEYMFTSFFNWLESTIAEIAAVVFDVVDLTTNVISDIVTGVIDFVGAILDWIFPGSCDGDAISAEQCQ